MNNLRKYRSKFRAEASSLRTQLAHTRELLRDGILSDFLQHYETVTGDVKPLGYLRSRRYDLLWAYSDSLDAAQSRSSDEFFARSQLQALIKKYPWRKAEVPLDPEGKAIAAFLLSEHRCKRMNQWFRAARRCRPERLHVFSEARAYISYVLGDEPDVDECLKLANFSAGASLGIHGAATHLGRKAGCERVTVTRSAIPFLQRATKHNYHLETCWWWAAVSHKLFESDSPAPGFEVVDYNKIEFVPKTAKTHRSIAVEPLGNGFIQKGIDTYMRAKLLRAGIDLSDQTLNQAMARQGSREDSLVDGFVTLDLSAASDSLSLELCRELLPPAWFSFLNCVRSPCYRLPGSETSSRYQKFASMGNGFCFPLETLIFAALTSFGRRAGRDWSTYGDDIIVRKDVGARAVELLNRAGFRLNLDKSFLEGPFRESCGSDWYCGQDVRPFTWDFELQKVQDLYKFVNLARRSSRTTEALRNAINRVLDVLYQYPSLCLWRPWKGNADTGLDPLDIRNAPMDFPSRNRGLQAPQWLELTSTSVGDQRDYPPWVVMFAALAGVESANPFPFRRKTKTRLRVCVGWGSPDSQQPRSLVGQRILKQLRLPA